MEGHLTPLSANLIKTDKGNFKMKTFHINNLKKYITRPEIENVICLFDCDSDWTELPLAAGINVEMLNRKSVIRIPLETIA